jgi:hypothetical protein
MDKTRAAIACPPLHALAVHRIRPEGVGRIRLSGSGGCNIERHQQRGQSANGVRFDVLPIRMAAIADAVAAAFKR